MASAGVRRRCPEAEGWTSGGEHCLAEESSRLQTSVYIHVHAHIHTPSHTDPHTDPLSCTQLYLKYICVFLMPCPSQMVEDEEEGSQVNSARRWLLTPPLLELLPALANGKKANRQTWMSPWRPAVRGAYVTLLLSATL